MSTTWGDIKGNTTTDASEAQKFINWWFRADDIVALRAIPGDGPIYSMAGKRDDLTEMLTTVDADSNMTSMQEISDEGRNLYFNICHVKAEMPKTKKKGIKGDDIKGFRGLFADIDCKDGAFGSEEEVMEWVRSLEVQPGAIVHTGSGGVHLYWKTKNMEQKDFTVIQKRWWSHLRSVAPEGVAVDRLVDAPRIARLPGGTRHPKKMEPAAQVTVEYTDAEPVDGEQFTKLTETPYKHFREEMKALQSKEDQILMDMVEGATPTIGQLALRDALMNRCGDLVSWSEILEGSGWKHLRTNNKGADVWERPGGHGKSAHTGYPDQRAAMALHSTDEGTGLADLKAQDIKMSKWRVFLRLVHNDDVRAAELDILEREIYNA